MPVDTIRDEAMTDTPWSVDTDTQWSVPVDTIRDEAMTDTPWSVDTDTHTMECGF